MHEMEPIALQGWTLLLPKDFHEHYAESKGYFKSAIVVRGDTKIPLTFYDPVRLALDVKEELASGSVFFESNVVVISNLDRPSIVSAVENLAKSGVFKEAAKK